MSGGGAAFDDGWFPWAGDHGAKNGEGCRRRIRCCPGDHGVVVPFMAKNLEGFGIAYRRAAGSSRFIVLHPQCKVIDSPTCFVVTEMDISEVLSSGKTRSQACVYRAKILLLTKARSVTRPLERLKEWIKMSQAEYVLIVSSLGISSRGLSASW